jgi:Glycosyl hydrolases family 25
MPVAASSVFLLPDLSEFQPDADMAGIAKQNGGAAIIRACYGGAHPDKVFAKFRKAAAGYRFLGLYQYLVAGQDVIAQARAFCSIAGHLAAYEVPIVDVEEGAGSQYQRAIDWCGHVDRQLGKRSWVYSGVAFAEAHGLASIFASSRHTWVAAYSQAEPSLAHTLWQCTDGKTGSHITSWPGAGKCDTSLYHGSLAQLAALITPPVPRPPRPKEPRMIMVTPDRKDIPEGTGWPGDFLLFADGRLHHIASHTVNANNVAAYKAAGVPGPVEITWAEYQALLAGK